MKVISQTLGNVNVYNEVTKYLSEHSFAVSLWGVLTGILSKTLQIETRPHIMVASLADITLILSFLIAMFTVLLKVKEFLESYFPNFFKYFKKTKPKK